MKSLRVSMSPFVLILPLLSLLMATSADADDDAFLDCLSLRPNYSSSLSRLIFTPNNSSFSWLLESRARNLRFSTETTPRPLVIITPLHVSHIQATIYCAEKHGLQIRTRSGGHDFEGLSYVSHAPFVVVDMVRLRSVDIDVRNKVAWVQSGAVLGELYYNLANKSNTVAFPAGLCPTVGIGGHLSGGGYGLLSRKYGLAIDNVIDAQLVDVNGRVLDRKSMGEDLFWAIRGGGGGSFGIVVSWKLRLVSVPPTVSAFTVDRNLEQNATNLIHQWQSVAPRLPNDFYNDITIRRVNGTIRFSFRGYFLGGIDEAVPLMRERFPMLGLTRENFVEMSWIESILYMGNLPNESLSTLLDRTYQSPFYSPYFKSKSDYVRKPIPEIGLGGLWRHLFEEEGTSGRISFISYGGKMGEIPATAKPFPHRAGTLFQIVYEAGWEEEEEENVRSKRYIRWLRRLYKYMGSFVSKSPRQAYVNYRDLDIGTNNQGNLTSLAQASVWGRKYFMNNFHRLVCVKTMIDPRNFFRHEQSIPPFPH
ncbi:FAD-binding Berberine family protein [Hibiscus syriacus]|uniref:FAD-binding Berberine family protein n=1 Tax=Hibiscus syriacus TaxID=106335 RepID=A0A6A2ZLD1_HIBSY|nr:berberine bridge enzyme-like 8 [Hibiscus syriacus]KAE8692376.1 FAD-binding Berberine family protein [Hibiscus syriacus]